MALNWERNVYAQEQLIFQMTNSRQELYTASRMNFKHKSVHTPPLEQAIGNSWFYVLDFYY
jgi:hypothetical protein